MAKNISIVLLAALVLWLAAALARVENERYALYLGMCRNAQSVQVDYACLGKVQTRTSPIWHLYYALTD